MVQTTQWQQWIISTLKRSRLWGSLKEIGLFAGIFCSVFILSIAFVNANLLYHSVKGIFQPVQAESYTFTSDGIGDLMHDQSQLQTFMQENTQDATLSALKKDHSLFVPSKQKIEAQLQDKDYNFSYSLVPPGNRLFIPAIWVDAPIVDISFASETKLKHGDFNAELYSWVVKYPSTPEPWHKGNSLIFWHTSFYRWKKNPYGEVFAKIYDLKKGDAIKVARKWQLYTYEIVESIVVKPSEVDVTYMKYTDWEYITLMGCYPIWSDARRWLIIAKRKKADTKVSSVLSN
jgi:LPXTG-site transpeptidase (sortase) family protein